MNTMKTLDELNNIKLKLSKELCFVPLCNERLNNIYVIKIMMIDDQMNIKRLYDRINKLSEQKQKVIIIFDGKGDILDIVIKEIDAKMNGLEEQIIILKRKTYDVNINYYERY